jgi:peptidoglycan/LPS O-acetylase OafA/YrhL
MSKVYRPDIDGIRAIAVTAVVLFHYFPTWVKGGFVGVDIFFVLSGYLITQVICSEMDKKKFSLVEFYSRRIRRILPAMLACIAVTVLVGYSILLKNEFAYLIKSVLYALTFVPNFQYWMESGYFDTEAESKPLLNFWSLGVEEQYYFVWPLILMAFVKSAADKKTGAIAVALVLAITSFSLCLYLSVTAPNAAFYLPQSRAWELMAGGILALTNINKPAELRRSDSFGRLSPVIGLGIIIYSIFNFSSATPFPSYYAGLPVCGTLLLLRSDNSIIARLLSKRVFVLVGRVSYSWYLWHWPILSFAVISNGGPLNRYTKIYLIGFSFLIALVSYRFIERPFRTGSLVGHGHKYIIFATSAVLAIVVSVDLAGFGPRQSNPNIEVALAAASDKEFPEDTKVFKTAAINGVKYMHLDTKGQKVTVFIGDSHVQHLAPRLKFLAESYKDKMNTVLIAASGGCAPIPNVYGGGNEPSCSTTRRAAFELASSDTVDVVVIAACWNCYFIHQKIPDANIGELDPFHYYYDDKKGRSSFRNGNGSDLALISLETTLRELKNKGKRVFLLTDNPYGEEIMPTHYLAGSRWGSPMTLALFNGIIDEPKGELEVDRIIKEISSLSGATLIDLRAEFCSEGKCRIKSKDGQFIFQDRNHIRAKWMRDYGSFIDQTVLAK